MDIRCRKTNCKYNKDLTCLANKINISKKLNCLSYESEKGKGIKDFSKLIFSENPPKVANYRHIKDMCLYCDANCMFNKNHKCLSNGITINAATTIEPRCITFIKP